MNRIKIVLIVLFLFPCFLFAQEYLPFEEEIRIKFSDDYYWAESSDFSLEQATIQAMDCLVDKIISDAVFKTIERNEVLEALELKVNKARIRQEGKAHVFVWVAKDRVSIMSQKPLQSKLREPDQPRSEMPQQSNDNNFGGDTNSAIEALKRCKNYKEVNRVTRQFGFMRGEINSSNGFDHPERCIIAVFSADYAMVALLDKGVSSRVDLLTGQVISNPELYYDKEQGYKLWYFQQ
jgi:hypothetical protein